MSNAIMQLPDSGIQQVNGAIDHYNTLVLFMQHSLREGLDYGKIQGCGDKPILFKPGAEKIATLFGLRESLERLEAIKDWTGKDFGEPFFNFEYKCTLKNREGHIVAECVGSCNSWEEKYRYRTAQRVCPQCGAAAIKRSQYEDRQTGDKGWYCHSKSGGCNAKFRSDDPQITSQQQGKVPNERIFDQVNTIDKMAQKRCLGSSTQILMKTSRGISRSKLETLWTVYSNGNEDVFVPGIDGTWRKVEGMTRDQDRPVYRLDLADGSWIRATAEHKFPTVSGLKEVAALKVGDRLLRSRVVLPGKDEAMPEFGYIAGLYIAEGSTGNKGKLIRFTLHKEEVRIISRIEQVALWLGAKVKTTPKGVSNCVTVSVQGEIFRGIIEQFTAGEKSYGKHFSKSVWQQKPEFLQALLEGYLDGDGSWTESRGRRSYWRVGFTGQNYRLAEDLRALCNILGHRISLKRSSSKCKGVDFPTFVGWIKDSYKSYNQKCLEEIVGITLETKPATVYDVQVDGDHLFCLADGIQTHNSFVGAVILAANASNFFAVEHSEIQTLDADWEPQEDIGSAAHLERVPGGGEAVRDQGQLNRDRIQLIIGRTEHTLAQVKQMAGGKTADQLDDGEMDDLINRLLIDWGRQRHHVSFQIAKELIDEIRSEQPRITDNNLILRFAQRCSEALSEQVPTRRQTATTVGGVSID